LARVLPLLKYLLWRTETHAYCAAIGFFAVVAFYPLCWLLAYVEAFVVLGGAYLAAARAASAGVTSQGPAQR
jgi:hypothetical protein